jgi:hypothetical protein
MFTPGTEIGEAYPTVRRVSIVRVAKHILNVIGDCIGEQMIVELVQLEAR